MRILCQSPELEKLDLCHFVTAPDSWPQECISLESLYELSLVFACTRVAMALFEHIDCPVLVRLFSRFALHLSLTKSLLKTEKVDTWLVGWEWNR